MASSRKDSRGYMLKTGECQRSDGRYSYAYTGKGGNRRTVYAPTLAELRKKERQIIRDIEDGIDAHSPEKITLNQLWDKYFSTKHDLKPTTRAGYKYNYDRYVRDGFGKKKITEIKYSDVKEFYYSIILDKKLSSATLDNVHTDLHPAFDMAVRDGLLRTNPTDGVMKEIKKSQFWNNEKKKALTIPQQKKFTEFIRDSREFQGWAPVLMVLLGTGMRIGECIGLRWDD
ncbi:MAG: integrase DNA-binding domain-containing protein, partial [Lachnospiraceae bacterium]|nr:integrase DNA-binding domain-containing protein [Lachnospiraceae bacterium]